MANKDAGKHATRMVLVDGAAIAVNEWGEGPPILFVHGNPDSGVMWEGIAKQLATHRRCVAFDLPGFGRSQVPADYRRTLDGMAEFVEHFLRAAKITPPLDIVAHDFGGPFAFAWATKHPAALRRLVAVNTAFFSDYRWHFWARVWRTPVLGEIAMATMNRTMFARGLRRASPRLPVDHVERTFSLMTWRMRMEVLRLYRQADFENLKNWEPDFLALATVKPTLVIWGDRDPFIATRFAERFNARRVVHLPDIGHWPPVEAPAACADAIARFFAENE
jgi:pimeloyl-ACP methyl ester carboxylesterase